MFVVYEGDDEALITTKENEQQFLLEYFNDQSDRYIDDYDRSEFNQCGLTVTTSFRIRFLRRIK